MRRLLLISVIMLTALALCGCSDDRGLETTHVDAASVSDPPVLAAELATLSGWPIVDEDARALEGYGDVIQLDREELGGGVVHYSYELCVGEGTYDVIGLHRVVREYSPNRPIRTHKAVLLQHGDAVGFAGIFLAGSQTPNLPDDQSIAFYLAENDVDVWGIDQNWVLVPQEVTDFSFMADWGMQNQVDNLDIALSVARLTRLFTGSGKGQMHLLGYSSGSSTGYAYLNAETQKPPLCRNVKGYIPVDMAFKTDDAGLLGSAGYFASVYQGLYDSGQYQDMVLFGTIGYLAVADPDGTSPLAPPFTNYQVGLVYGAATHMFVPLVPAFHYLAGEFDPVSGLPTGFQFVTNDGFFDFLMGAAPWEPVLFQLDYLKLIGDVEDMPFDDFLGAVTVPVFNVGSGGCMGAYTDYTLGLLGSDDVTSLIVSLYPPEAVMIDFGHIDLFIGDNAETLVWGAILNWIEDHSGNHNYATDKISVSIF